MDDRHEFAPSADPFAGYQQALSPDLHHGMNSGANPTAHTGGAYLVAAGIDSSSYHGGPAPASYMDLEPGSVGGSLSGYNHPVAEGYSPHQSTERSEPVIKREHSDDDDYVPGNLNIDDDFNDEADFKQSGKKRKTNKDGRMRKVRQPRASLRRWDETDISRALLGIVWACGENGVQIPFDQAAQLVDQTCTASALQQAILKLQTKLNEGGEQIPRIKMNWPKKRDAPPGGVTRDNGKLPRKKPTLTQATQCNITSLRASPREDIPTNGASDGRTPDVNTNVRDQLAQLPYRPAMMKAAGITDRVPSSDAGAATPLDLQSGPSYTPSTLGAKNDQVISENESQLGQYVKYESAETEDVGMKDFMSELAQSLNLPSTPEQLHSSPVCPSAPRRSTAIRHTQRHLPTDAPLDQRLDVAQLQSSHAPFVQQRTFGHMQQHDLKQPMDLQNGRLQQGPVGNIELGSLAAFNAESEKRHTASLALSHQPQLQKASRGGNSDMNSGPSMSRRALLSPRSDGMVPNSPISSRFQQDSPSQELDVPFDMQLSPDLKTLISPRKDSAVSSGAQSTVSMHHSDRFGNDSTRAANNKYQASLAVAAADRPMHSMPPQATGALSMRQHSRQLYGVGLNTLDNPFGGQFGDAGQNAFTFANRPGYGFGHSTTIGSGSAFGNP